MSASCHHKAENQEYKDSITNPLNMWHTVRQRTTLTLINEHICVHDEGMGRLNSRDSSSTQSRMFCLYVCQPKN